MKGIISASDMLVTGYSGIFHIQKYMATVENDIRCQKVPDVEKIMWSEEVYSIPIDKLQNGKNGSAHLFLE